MENATSLGQRIYLLRMQRNETQEIASEAIGISHVSLGRYESGARQPSADVLVRIAKHYGVSVDYIVGNQTEDEEEDELWSFREECRRDPERRRLFKVAKYGSLNQVKQADAIINALAATNPDYYDGDDPA